MILTSFQVNPAVSPEVPDPKPFQAAALIRQAKKAIALTGAGISTPSGIPDFRSPGSGIWKQTDAMEVASITAFLRNPRKVMDWMRPLAKLMLASEPNPAHLALADLEEAGLLRGVITQNIDDLHNRAGSKNILEVHGHMRQATCLECKRETPAGDSLRRFVESGELPKCEVCSGILKPNVVFFGEQLPYAVMSQASTWVGECDLMIVVGSSLEVTPVSYLPLEAHEAGAKLIILNHDQTYVDHLADVIIREDVAESLPQIAQAAISS